MADNTPASDKTAPAAATGTIEDFAASIAHDVNNLLTGILGNLELMQNRARRNGHAEYDTYLDGARSAGLRAAVFARRLAAVAGRDVGPPTATDLAAVIADLIAPLAAQGHHITADISSLVIQCDPAQAELALSELLNNAVAATPAAGPVTIRAATEAGIVILEVRDLGPGMAPDILARAAQPFFTTHPNGTGRGLGLPIADRFARNLGGTLRLSSTPGAGTAAILHLPETAR